MYAGCVIDTARTDIVIGMCRCNIIKHYQTSSTIIYKNPSLLRNGHASVVKYLIYRATSLSEDFTTVEST